MIRGAGFRITSPLKSLLNPLSNGKITVMWGTAPEPFGLLSAAITRYGARTGLGHAIFLTKRTTFYSR